jgi:hypothetical protein
MPDITGAPLRLGDLTARTRPIEVERNGASVILRGYVDGNRCPVHVKAEVSAARRIWVDATGAGSDTYAYNDTAWRVFLRDALLATIKGLEFGEAEVLASDDELATTVLTTLEWFKTPGTTADPEATGETTSEPRSTTPSSSPGSTEPTPASIS